MKTQTIFNSVDDMLALDSLSALLGTTVNKVIKSPFAVAHRSANELYELRVETASTQLRLILKEFQPQRDWVMRLTHDTLTREAMLFKHGIYSQMPPEITVPVIAAARHHDTWATLMKDVSAELLPLNVKLPEQTAVLLLKHLAALHAHFWNDSQLAQNSLGLSSLTDFVTILSPAQAQNELNAGRAHPVLQLAVRGWEQFNATAPANVRSVISSLQHDPSRLLAVLHTMPQTLLHGDYKVANLGVSVAENPSTIALDWQDAARGPGVLDLGYFLILNARWLPFSRERAIERYSEAMADLNKPISSRDIEIGLLAGGALRLLWLIIGGEQEELDWWYEHVLRAGSELDHA